MPRPTLATMLLALAPLALGGCLAAEPRTFGRDLSDPSVPRSFKQAHYLEERGLENVRIANEQRLPRRRRDYFDSALSYFRRARDLYTRELVDCQSPPERRHELTERRRNLRREIQRLEELISRTHAERPIGG